MTLQKSHLAFTPVTLSSLDPPTPEPALPISSPSVSKLQPDAAIHPREQPDPCVKPDTLPHSSRKSDTKNIEATSVPPRHHRQIGIQVNITETTEEHRKGQKFPSPLTSESTEGRWLDTRGKKASTVKGKMGNERCEKTAPSSRRKKSERYLHHHCIASHLIGIAVLHFCVLFKIIIVI